jgi:hypothetical protein
MSSNVNVEHTTSTITDHVLSCGEFELRWSTTDDALRGHISLVIGRGDGHELLVGPTELRDLRDLLLAGEGEIL